MIVKQDDEHQGRASGWCGGSAVAATEQFPLDRHSTQCTGLPLAKASSRRSRAGKPK